VSSASLLPALDWGKDQSINHIYVPKQNLNRLVNASTKMAGYTRKAIKFIKLVIYSNNIKSAHKHPT